ncbi:MarR family transcriptional regulator [Arthrobacter sp. MI7-26]|uniref:MarR family winged helix-turn-helix transcriptional regulator n=1 Tax=Arthrobacter sp. MI7-26 TaxID=2993653 RepID=UPI002248C13F|nr:MarR family transcriptional regulator [Arthrobacter sp. MI7-26]MCX2748081.1 MarR family transcriptional regulator [Arthrobacter sp. MI7-26]
MAVDPKALADAVLAVYDVTLRTTQAASPTLEKHGLTFNTAYVLWAIDPADPPPPMGVVAERTRCTPPNLTFLCDQLESGGLILRTTSVTDRRQRIVQLTPAGRLAREAVVESVVKFSPLSALGSDALADLHRILCPVSML